MANFGDYVTAMPYDSDHPIQGMVAKVYEEDLVVITESQCLYICRLNAVVVQDKDIVLESTLEWLKDRRAKLRSFVI